MKKVALLGLLLFLPPALAAGETGYARGYNLIAVTAASQPRLDVFRAEVLSRSLGLGAGVSFLTVRYGNWKYSADDRSHDWWGNTTAFSSYETKASLKEYFPVSLYYSPYAWKNSKGGLGNVRVYYEHTVPWLTGDTSDIPVNCEHGIDPLGDRHTREYGILVDSGGSFRFKAGNLSMRRKANSCEADNDYRTISVKGSKYSRWYAGIEFLFGGVSKRGITYAGVFEDSGEQEEEKAPPATHSYLAEAPKAPVSRRVQPKRQPPPTYGAELEAIPRAAKGNASAVGVVIGVQKYAGAGMPAVDYALSDAELVKRYLVGAMGYSEENIIHLENPTKGDLEKVFGNKETGEGQLAHYLTEGADIFVYYTGHGAPDLGSKEPYLLPSDAGSDYVKLGGYPLRTLYGNLSKLAARRVTVVIDACFSGLSGKGSLFANASPLLVVPTIPGAGKINIFSSARAEELASWYPDKRHSLFTYFFLKGLQGAADKNRDNRLTNLEVHNYALSNVDYYAGRLFGRRQHPTFSGRREDILAEY